MIARKGFTLIELLIVIGILAILATTVVLVLNPAQILEESRDTQRISDLGSVQSAVGLLLATATSTVTFSTEARCTIAGTTGFSGTPACTVPAATDIRTVGGAGWLGINLNGTSGGSTLSTLPVDPQNSGNFFYAYRGNNNAKTFELNARLESVKHQGLMENDGGNQNICTDFEDATCWYEIGTEPGLDL